MSGNREEEVRQICQAHGNDRTRMMDIVRAVQQQYGCVPTDLMRVIAERFDLDLLSSYMAIINWAVPFDDMFQNHFLYQRVSDGKWLLFPWDLDQDFGEWKAANASFYMGELGDPDNRSGWWNYLKDAFLKSYRVEFEDRLLLT